MNQLPAIIDNTEIAADSQARTSCRR